MARTDLEQLVFTMSADIKGLERQLARATGATDKAANRMDRRLNTIGGGFGKEIGRQASAATSSLGSAGAALTGFGAAGLGVTAVVGGLTIALRAMAGALQFADDLDASATKLGVTAERLQELTFAAHENDITTEQLEASLQGLNVALGAYKRGVGDAKVKKAFENLGITRESLKDVNSAADFLPILADRIAAVQSQASRTKLAAAMGAADLEPLLRKGSAAITEATERMRALGIVMSDELATKAADANRELEVMGEIVTAKTNIALAEMAVWLVEVAKLFGPLLTKMREFKAENGREIRLAAGFFKSGLIGQLFPGAQFLFPGDRTAGDSDGLRSFRSGVAAGRAPGGGPPGPPETPDIDPPVRSSRVASKPRYAGPLPDYVKQAVKDGRFTEASIREAYPDGNFPGARQIAEVELIKATGLDPIEGYDASAFSRGQFDDGRREGPPSLVAGRKGVLMSAEEAQAVHDQYAQTIEGALWSAIMDGGPGVAEYFGQMFAQALVKDAASGLSQIFTDFLKSSQGGSVGSFLASIIPGFASGTRSAPGGLAWVGEKGPELLNLPRGAGVSPLSMLGSGPGFGGRGGGVVQYITVQAPKSILSTELVDRIDLMGQASATIGGGLGESGARSSVPSAMSRQAMMSLSGK